MKPLHVNEIETFYKRFDNASGGEIRKLTILNPTAMILRLSVQDASRAFDWIDLELEVSGVSDARLIEDSKLRFIDMSEGISILFEDNNVIVCVGNYSSFDAAHNAPLFIRGSALKYQENNFSA